jgi:glycosyltransferase involved in cell wall biosynthesis
LADVRARSLEFLIPGDLQSATGGYGYDRRIMGGLRELGWRVGVHSLDASFPLPTEAALAHAEQVFSGFLDDALVMVDGLALGAMPGAAARHAERLRLVALVHHPLAAETGLSREDSNRLKESERASLRSVRHVVVTSEATAMALAPYEVEATRISVIVPGTDEAPLASGSAAAVSLDEVAAQAGLTKGAIYGDRNLHLLCVASLTPRKGHDLLVDALSALSSLPWKLTCVGRLARGNGTAEALQGQIHRASLEERIALAGELTGDALEAAYQSADLFVLPTRYEGYGMVVAEALARGIPVISTRTGAIPYLVGSDAGLLVSPGDGDAFQDALARVLRDPALLASLRTGARAARDRLPRWSQSCAMMSHALERLIPS